MKSGTAPIKMEIHENSFYISIFRTSLKFAAFSRTIPTKKIDLDEMMDEIKTNDGMNIQAIINRKPVFQLPLPPTTPFTAQISNFKLYIDSVY